MESGFWSRAACSKHSRALSQTCFLLCDPMFRFAQVLYLLRMLLPPWDLKRAPVLSLAGRQILLACDRINKVRCLPVSVIQGKCFMWVAFYAQEQKGCCLFLYLPIGIFYQWFACHPPPKRIMWEVTWDESGANQVLTLSVLDISYVQI